MRGKKGNKNAQKHGIYSKRIAVIQDNEGIENTSPDDNTAELAHARAMLADASDRRKNATDDKERLNWDFACPHWSKIALL